MLERIIFGFVMLGLSMVDSAFLPTQNVVIRSLNAEYFHVSMLSISLIMGLSYCVFALYNYWYKGKLLSCFNSLILAQLLRTFFTLLIESVVVIGKSRDDDGTNTLLTFEMLGRAWSLSYWLLVTIYFHECIETDFNSEPNLKLFHYGVPGIATYFTFMWVFIMAGEAPRYNWMNALIINSAYNWILHTMELLYLLIQFGLTLSIGRMILQKKSTYDNDCLSLLRKSGTVVLALVALEWIMFGLIVGKSSENTETYFYFLYIVDGLQCAIACPLLFFLEKWGRQILIKNPRSLTSETARQRQVSTRGEEIVVNGHSRPIPTIESVYATRISRRMETDAQDVAYSSVLPPEQLQKMFDMYKRLNLLPVDNVTVVADEKFYECQDDAVTRYEDAISQETTNSEELPRETNKTINYVQKRNAFYCSQYLIVNPKRTKFPKLLGTQSSTSNDKLNAQTDSSMLTLSDNRQISDNMVEKWLRDNSKNAEKF